jgi:HK97 family phage major capsid protein
MAQHAGLPMLLGYPVFISPSMPALATGQTAIAFGDLDSMARRIVSNSLVARVLTERYAEFGQVGVETLYRTDFQLLKTATTQPVKFITMG